MDKCSFFEGTKSPLMSLTSKEGFSIHQSAVQTLKAYEKLLKANMSSTELNLIKLNYEVPEPLCPKKDISFYDCDPSYPYRSVDGSCNNLRIPWWGKKETPFKRILAAEYDDGINSPKTYSKIKGKYLPNPRSVAMEIHAARRTFPETTQMLIFFAQFVDHDVTFTSKTTYNNGVEKKCSCGANDEDCFQIPIPKNDKWNKDQQCFPFTRSSAAIYNFECKFAYREQLNLFTSWTDLSSVYGTSEKMLKSLRTFSNGLLKTSKNPFTGYDSFAKLQNRDCTHLKPLEKCFLAGDSRIEDNHYLTMFTKIFYTEHNRIAKLLYQYNPLWDDEYLFQEARKINIGQYNHIIYWELLPILLGNYAMQQWDLTPLTEGFFEHYDYKTNPQTTNEFATAAMRIGHVLVNKFHLGYNNEYELEGNWTTNQVISTTEFGHRNSYNNIVRGALLQNSYYFTPAVNDYMGNWLFTGLFKNFKRLSLPALNIQRGRDHGLPGYNRYRKYCGLNYANKFEDFTNIPAEVRKQMASLYATPDDVDLWTGIVSEFPVEDGVVGPTAACMI